MGNLLWVLQDGVFGDETYLLIKAIEAAGDEVEVRDTLKPMGFRDRPCVVRGSAEFVTANDPGFSLREFKCSHYYHRMSLPLQNRHGVWMTWGMLKKNHAEMFEMFENDRLFIRPDSGLKLFTGTTIGRKWAMRELEVIEQLPGNKVDDDTLVLVNDEIGIGRECRVLAYRNEEVVSWSMYQGGWVSSDEPQIRRAVSKMTWWPSNFYVIDFGFNGLSLNSVIELNSFNCAGLYEMDMDRVVAFVGSFCR